MPAGHHYSFPPKMLYHGADVRMPSQAIPYVLRTVRGALEAQGFQGVAVCGNPTSFCVPLDGVLDWPGCLGGDGIGVQNCGQYCTRHDE
jgi:hypothetical protein